MNDYPDWTFDTSTLTARHSNGLIVPFTTTEDDDGALQCELDLNQIPSGIDIDDLPQLMRVAGEGLLAAIQGVVNSA